MNSPRSTLLALVAVLGMAAAPAHSQTAGAAIGSQAGDARTSPTAADAATSPALTPEVCVVSDQPLGSMGAAHVVEHEGRKIHLCCKGCEGEFKKDPDMYLKKLDEQIIAQQGKTYSGKVCVVTGKELPAQGAKEIVVNEQLVRLCCGGCEAVVRADPDKYLQKLNAPGTAEPAAR